MKAHYTTAGGLNFEIDADSPKAMFKKIALVQEIFDSDKTCGACQSVDICFRSRQVDDFEFFELACRSCNARLQFGQHKKGGGLFPKRRDEDGHFMLDNGWAVFKTKTTAEPVPDARSQRRDEIDSSDVPF